ncbi:MAG: 2-oxo acid dehydrogenase subunit E2 [Gammaproteobacteria bacterium]|nr:MAG: 2-oxo acid dehydrogenase subunit E2 [Gammaproteobacteria bacterium]
MGGVGLEELATRRRAAVEAARAGRLNQTFASAASISLSSLAREAADEFEAIISPGQTAIVAVGRIAESVVSRRGEIVVRKGCRVCVAADHRVIDGRTGARFISAMVRVLEEGVAPG